MKTTLFAAVLGLGLLASGAAFATEAAAPAATPSPAGGAMKKDDGAMMKKDDGAMMKKDDGAMMKTDKAAMSAKSQECSKEADAKGLHGKERKHFREKCKKGEN